MNCKNELLTPAKVFKLHYPLETLVTVENYQILFFSDFITEASQQ